MFSSYTHLWSFQSIVHCRCRLVVVSIQISFGSFNLTLPWAFPTSIAAQSIQCLFLSWASISRCSNFHDKVTTHPFGHVHPTAIVEYITNNIPSNRDHLQKTSTTCPYKIKHEHNNGNQFILFFASFFFFIFLFLTPYMSIPVASNNHNKPVATSNQVSSCTKLLNLSHCTVTTNQHFQQSDLNREDRFLCRFLCRFLWRRTTMISP